MENLWVIVIIMCRDLQHTVKFYLIFGIPVPPREQLENCIRST